MESPKVQKVSHWLSKHCSHHQGSSMEACRWFHPSAPSPQLFNHATMACLDLRRTFDADGKSEPNIFSKNGGGNSWWLSMVESKKCKNNLKQTKWWWFFMVIFIPWDRIRKNITWQKQTQAWVSRLKLVSLRPCSVDDHVDGMLKLTTVGPGNEGQKQDHTSRS